MSRTGESLVMDEREQAGEGNRWGVKEVEEESELSLRYGPLLKTLWHSSVV